MHVLLADPTEEAPAASSVRLAAGRFSAARIAVRPAVLSVPYVVVGCVFGSEASKISKRRRKL